MHPLFRAMGFEGQRVVLWHHDDLGMTRSHNAAFFELVRQRGWATGSVICCGDHAQEVARAVGPDPAFDVGVHLALAGGFRPLTTGASLVDADGRMPPTNEDAWARLSLPDAEAELRAQIEQARAWGLDITHLDSHMGTLFRPDLLAVSMRLGVEYQLPVMLPRAGNFSAAPELQAELTRLITGSPLPVLDRVLMGWEIPPEQKKRWYLAQIRGLDPGVYPFLHHAAQATGETLWPGDLADFEAVQDPEVVAALGGLTHLTYRAVRDAMRRDGGRAPDPSIQP